MLYGIVMPTFSSGAIFVFFEALLVVNPPTVTRGSNDTNRTRVDAVAMRVTVECSTAFLGG
jgi:hypothetical protein